MHSYEECLGPPLMAALCALKDLEQFTHRATTTVRTEFGLHSLLRLAAAWPKLRVLHIAGDLETSHDVASLPPVTCKLQRVTLEACTANLEDLALLFAASSKSLKTLEMWTMAPGSLDAPIACVLPGLEVLRLGGCGHPSLAFIRDKLGAAPRLRTLQLGGGPDRTGRVRAALTTAMSDPALFCWLRQLEYPALALPEVEKAKPGKGKGKEKENALGMDGVNVGEAALLAVAAKRKIRASRAVDLEYTGEGGLRHSAEKWHKRAAAKKR
ncbi:hypothetical protein B0H15DRAFT_170379 [Mycena belliarum]|uniref:Uncharacterized protein n=1 Tax=Mycena belliarum TaxID=1033014 RepID=A0AAD6U9F0_9AGAR|nr:hypothetical protein B0H15DRAFT_170379 [Mycena belliae]